MTKSKMADARVLGSLLLAISALSAESHASLITDTVTCSATASGVCDTPSAVVGAGVEFSVDFVSGAVLMDVDIGAESISVTNTGPSRVGSFAAGETITLADLDWVGQPGGFIVGIENFFTSGTGGMVVSDVTFTGDSVTIDVDSGASWDIGGLVSFDLVTRHGVPEPGSVALLALGLLGLSRFRRVAFPDPRR